jgi:ankyrin repeat protein
MEGVLMRPTRPSYAITIPSTPFTTKLLKKQYTKGEIMTSVHNAAHLRGNVNFEDPIAVEEAWRDVHAITCDDAWGIGMGSTVDHYLRQVTQEFMRELIEHTSEYMDTFSIANFMTRYHRENLDEGYIRLLRIYLLAFPETFETPSTLTQLHSIYFPASDIWTCYHPMVMVASSRSMRTEIMHTLLQCGVSANTRCVSGKTALILACENIGQTAPPGYASITALKVDMLLNYGASLDDLDFQFNSAFHAAIVSNSKRTIVTLLAARKQRIEDSIKSGEEHWGEGSEQSEQSECDESDNGEEIHDDNQMEDEAAEGPESLTEKTKRVAEEDSTTRVNAVQMKNFYDTCRKNDYEGRLGEQLIRHKTFGPLNWEYANRFRNKHLLYADPLQVMNIRDESLLIYISKSLLSCNIRDASDHWDILNLFLEAGVVTEGNWGEDIKIPTRVGTEKRSITPGLPKEMHFGVARFWHGEEESDGALMFSVQKEGYNTQVHVQLEDVFHYIDVNRSHFPFHESPSRADILQIFTDMKFGSQFDYCAKKGLSSGEDFEFHFYVSQFHKVDDHHEYWKTGLLWSHSMQTEQIYHKHIGKIFMRFPKGPVAKHHFYAPGVIQVDEEDEPFYLGFTTVNKRLTFLQEALTQRSQNNRCHTFKMARLLCNPLITGFHGLTALQMLERNLAKTTVWKNTGQCSISGLHKNDRGLLNRVRKDHDEMLTHVDRNGLVNKTNSILFSACEKKMVDAYNERKAKTKARFTSIFHGLPDDVCAKIISFM